jgi:hypothetical protein
MAQPVWVLSVDLQTKTATFLSGMNDAAKGASGAFKDIKQGAGEMGREIGTKMTEARHGVMLLTEGFDTHLPRSITTFIAGLGPVGVAMEAAFPFLAIAVGAKLLIEHLEKVREEGERLTENQSKFVTAANNAFNALDQKLLQAGIHTDELNKNHLAALHKQLELIDRQSMDELVHSFDIVAKAADAVFADLKSHWYTQGIGAEGAQHALNNFRTEYDKLLAQGKSGEAADLLAGTLHSAERVLEMQKQYAANQLNASTGKGPTGQGADYNKFEAAALELKKVGVGVTEKEVQAQQQLVAALNDQLVIEARVSDLKRAQQANARQTTGKEITADGYKAIKAQLDAERAGLEEEDKLRDAARGLAIEHLQQGEREKIEATEKGSSARLAAIEASIKEENTRGLQETSFYRQLLTARVETVREMAQEEIRVKEEAGKEAAAHETKMGELRIAAEREHQQLINSSHRVTAQQHMAQETQLENEEYALKVAAYAREIAALDANGKNYQNKLRAIQDRETELTKQHENKLTQIKDSAEKERNARIASAEQHMIEEYARGFSQVIMGHQSFASMMASIGDQILSAMIQDAFMLETVQGRKRLSDARTAASSAFEWGWEHGGVAAPILAPVLAAGAFTAAMAFEKGGMVPGVGRGDIVPAMLSPGEHVDDKELTDGLRGMVRNGGASAATHVSVNYRPVYHVQTIDGDGIRGTLTAHADEFQKHFEQTLRKLNR